MSLSNCQQPVDGNGYVEYHCINEILMNKEELFTKLIVKELKLKNTDKMN